MCGPGCGAQNPNVGEKHRGQARAATSDVGQLQIYDRHSRLLGRAYVWAGLRFKLRRSDVPVSGNQ